LKVSTNVKAAMQCFENFGGSNAPNAPPPLVARLVIILALHKHMKLATLHLIAWSVRKGVNQTVCRTKE